MSAEANCPQCGGELSSESPQGLCSRCLMLWALPGAIPSPGGDEDGPPPGDPAVGGRPETVPPSVGDYEIEEEIGRGGMGVVYRARQVSLNRTVALKFAAESVVGTPQLMRRFQAEAEAAASLDHPNIVPVYEVGEHGNRPFFSMRLLDGGTLGQKMQEFRHDLRTAVGLIAKVARAVQAAHERGVLHRDLKPSNILLDERCEPQVADFGLAKMGGADAGLSLSGVVLGTPAYISPEQASGRRGEVTTASDIYSLGAVLYELVGGRPPFAGDSVYDVLRKVLEEEPTPLRAADTSVDRDLETVVLKCLEKDPRRRYRSAAALGEDLERWIDGRPVHARRARAPERLAKWVGRNPAHAAFAVTALLLVLTLSIGGPLVGIHQAQLAREEAAARESAADSLYFARMSLLAHSWESGDRRRLLELLGRGGPAPGERDRRGIAWRYWWQRSHLHDLTLREVSEVRCARFSPDGRWLAVGTSGGLVRIVDGVTGKEQHSLGIHVGPLRAMAFAPDGTLLATAAEDDIIALWELPGGKLRCRIRKPATHSLLISPDGGALVSAGDDPRVFFHNLRDGTAARPPLAFGSAPTTIALGPDGNLLAACFGGRQIRLWDLRRDSPAGELVAPAAPRLLRFAPDGALYSGHTLGSIMKWDLPSRSLAWVLQAHSRRVSDLRFSAAGDVMATAGDDRVIRLWRLRRGQQEPLEEGSIAGHEGAVWSVDLTPGGGRLASGGGDRTCKIWDTARVRDALFKFPSSLGWDSVAFSPDSRTLAVGSNGRSEQGWGRVYLWAIDPDGRAEPRAPLRVGFTIWKVAFVGDRRVAIAGGEEGGRIVLAGLDPGSAREDLPIPAEGTVRSLAVSPDRRLLAAGTSTGAVLVWDLADNTLLRKLTEHTGPVLSLAFSPDGRHLASAGNDKTVWLRETEGFRPAWHRPWVTATAVYSTAFSPDGSQLFTGDMTGAIHALAVSDGTPLGPPLSGHTDKVLSLNSTRDGRTLVSTGFDGRLTLWDLVIREEKSTLPGKHLFAAVSPGGQSLASVFFGRVHLYAPLSRERLPTQAAPAAPRPEAPRPGVVPGTSGVTLRATPFQAPHPEVKHIASRWQVREAGRDYLEHLVNDWSGQALESFDLPRNLLRPGRTYHWRVAYLASNGRSSPYCAGSTFATPPSPEVAVPIDLVPLFNRDVVADRGDRENDGFKGGEPPEFLLVSPAAEPTGKPTRVRGLPENRRVGMHRLGPYTGSNALQLQREDTAPVRLSPPPQSYGSIRFLMAAGGGNVSMPAIFEFADGTRDEANLLCNDWLNALPDAGGAFRPGGVPAISRMDRLVGSTLHDDHRTSLFEVVHPLATGRVLTSITLEPGRAAFSTSATTFNLFAVTGLLHEDPRSGRPGER